jgi:hypothetical protein
MFHAGVNIADNVVGADFSLRRAFHVLNRLCGDVQALKLLLRYGVGDIAHVAFDFFFAQRSGGHALRARKPPLH